jgi:hypothetical protein
MIRVRNIRADQLAVGDTVMFPVYVTGHEPVGTVVAEVVHSLSTVGDDVEINDFITISAANKVSVAWAQADE